MDCSHDHILTAQALESSSLEAPAACWCGLTLVLNQLPGLALIVSADGLVQLANEAAYEALELEKGRAAPAGMASLWNFSAGPPLIIQSGRGRVLSFTCRHFIWPEAGCLFLATGTDITGQSEEYAEGERSRTLEALGTMATEMAHQVRSPLTGIELYASVLSRELTSQGDEALSGLAENIRDGVASVNRFITNFLSLSQTPTPRPARLELAAVVDEALGRLEELLRHNDIGLLVNHRRAAVMVDPQLMEQVLTNIIINALEAMPKGGRLTLETSLPVAGRAILSLVDTGPGWGEVPVGQLYSPFYTTKEQALGLGLPVSCRLMEAQKGRLSVEAGPSGGTRVILNMPLAQAARHPQAN